MEDVVLEVVREVLLEEALPVKNFLASAARAALAVVG
jgi:hypothetical protein